MASQGRGQEGIPRPLQFAGLGVLVVVTFALVVLAITSQRTAPSTAVVDPGASQSAPAETEPVATTTPPRPQDAETMVFVLGDSFTGGSRENTGETWPRLLGAELGWVVETDGAGGTGYISAGGPRLPIPQRASEVGQYQADLIVLAGGRNDMNRVQEEVTTVEDVAAAAAETVRLVREANPTSDILMLSPFSSGEANEITDELTAALAAVADESGLPYIDVSGYLVANEIGGDGEHPNDAGHAAIAAQIGPELDALSLPNPAKWQPTA